MAEAIDEHFVARITAWIGSRDEASAWVDPDVHRVAADRLSRLLDAQMQSRHLDFAARWLQSQGEGYYTIGSAGHESNAAVAMSLRPRRRQHP